MKKTIPLITILVAGHVHAATTAGINFALSGNTNNSLNARSGDLTAGVGIYATDTWTDIDPNGFTFSNASVASSQGGQAALLSNSHTTGFNGFSGSVNAMADSNDRTLMNAYTSYNSGDAGVFTLSSISSDFTSAAGGYTLVVYFESDNNTRTGTITVNDSINPPTSVSGLDGSTFSGTYVEATGSNDSNYAVFTGLTASSIEIDIDSDAGRMGITGMTLYAVPEPSSAALLGLGGLSLILRRRK